MGGKDSVATYNVGARVLFGASSNRSLQTRDRYDYVHNINPRSLARKIKAAPTSCGPLIIPNSVILNNQQPDNVQITCVQGPFPACALECSAVIS
jgi:hypothetical protein